MSKKATERSRSRAGRRRWSRSSAAARAAPTTIIAGVVGVVVVLLAVAVFLGSRGDTSGEAATEVPAGVDDYTVSGRRRRSAPTTITVYEDPQCPICRAFEAEVADAVAEAVEAGEVQVEYRIVSFLDHASANDYSSRAANALMAVQDIAGPDAFAEIHRILFENQPAEGSAGPDDDQLVDWAVQAGAEEAEVRPLIEDKVFEQFVVNATDQMSKDGVNGTPTVLIDGEPAGETPQESRGRRARRRVLSRRRGLVVRGRPLTDSRG